MNTIQTITKLALENKALSEETCLEILSSETMILPQLLSAAYEVRHHYWQNKVRVHMLNNVQNGSCPEDCKYCAQANSADTEIAGYKMKSDEEIIAEAKRAYENGAFRYCMVFSGRGPRKRRVEHMAELVKKIKATVPVEVCLSAGLIDSNDAQTLKSAGLDRFNHNLNTSESHYNNICSTHSYQDRLNTLSHAKSAGIELCSGFIAGMKEKPKDIVELAFKLKALNVESIPVNFLIPIEGTGLQGVNELNPNYCLRILTLLRFMCPKAEIRMAAGREMHLKSNQILGLFAANSLFIDGYLNVKGDSASMITQLEEAGFAVDNSFQKYSSSNQQPVVNLKTHKDLHPTSS